MVALPTFVDPTLEAADRAQEDAENRKFGRPYLGMSAIGHSCRRKLWYDFRWVSRIRHDAVTLKRFADGHAGEELQAERLRRVPGLTLSTHNEATGEQWGFEDHDGHFRGHMDGAILGLLQAPQTWHVWEHKQVGDKKLAELEREIAKLGEKSALAAWNPVYYAQAVLYMHYSGMERHYLTCSSAGGRQTISVRTNADPAQAAVLIAKAAAILNDDKPPARLSQDPAYFECRWCDHAAVCHEGAAPVRSCRSCTHAAIAPEAGWLCRLHHRRNLLVTDQQAGCDSYTLMPELAPPTQAEAAAPAAPAAMPWLRKAGAA